MKKIVTFIIAFPFLIIVLIISLFISVLKIVGILGTKSYPDNIDRKKSLANLYVLQNRTYELAKSRSQYDEKDENLLKHATESIKKFDFDKRPVGFSLEFIATYPDVVSWVGQLPDEELKKLLNQYNENEMLSSDGLIRHECLRATIDAYKATGAKLECEYD